MTTTRTRSQSPNGAGPSTKKARKVESTDFINRVTPEKLQEYRETYKKATPYRHAVVKDFLSDELLEGVVEESRTYGIRGEEDSHQGWGWEQKETDIYKIQQTPDLSSLDSEHLPDETLAALPQITKLKEALYSEEFRNLVREVTGCGPLSGKKTDGSVGLYTEGSHLLLHDDSISTRLISYILYLPNSPADKPATGLNPSASGSFLKGWDPQWGGSLELYPVENGEEVGLPGVKRVSKVDVSWGQIIFFEVKPGRSYHAVEEVICGEGRQRLGVSGWFHRPIEGEEGYDPNALNTSKDLSSLAQITAAPTIPFTPYEADPPAGLTPSHLKYLSDFLAPSYLSTTTLEKLSGQFVEASEIVLHNFLKTDLADKIKQETKSIDERDNPNNEIPSQSLGEGDGWTLQGPTSKHRYANLTSESTSTPTLESVLRQLLPSEAFRAWISVVSSLAPVGYRAEARRFRKGLDYTLAGGEENAGEARLDVCLGTTWWADVEPGSDEEDKLVDNGGWDCYLASPDEDEDPAVFQSSRAKKSQDDQKPDNAESVITEQPEAKVDSNQVKEKKDGPSISMNGTELEFDPDQFSPSDFDSDSDAGSDDDGPLLTLPVSFNKLLIVLRDPGVMKFVKYLGHGAQGSRWDVGGEWEVGVMEEDGDDDAE